MKKLLNKSLRTFSIYALFVLAASIPAYFYIVDSIWLKELDEHNAIIAMRTEKELNEMKLSEMDLIQSIKLWNSIQPGTSLRKMLSYENIKDSIFVENRQNPYLSRIEIDRFRGLKKQIHINEKPYELTVETNIEETEEMVAWIAGVTLFFFVVLIVGFLVLNRRLSKTLWKPFRIALLGLKEFNLNNHKAISFPKTDILEFNELNLALKKLIHHNISVYRGQKEFTENASHELQTPLSVIKGKLNLLLQDEPLTLRQYQLIEEIDAALSRITRINRNLLILAKIENHQFQENEHFDFNEVLLKIVTEMSEIGHHDIVIDLDNLETGFYITANRALAEMLISNLLSNAIRYTDLKEKISISFQGTKLNIINSGDFALDSQRIFSRFSSFNNEGSGLGLSIVKEICNDQGWVLDYSFDDDRHIFSISF